MDSNNERRYQISICRSGSRLKIQNVYSTPFTVYLLMNSTKLNGVNTQQLGSLMNTLMEKPATSKATFFVKTEWNSMEGGFCVRSSIKDFEIGGQSIQRNNTYTMVFDFPPEFSGEGKGPTVCEACMSKLRCMHNTNNCCTCHRKRNKLRWHNYKP